MSKAIDELKDYVSSLGFVKEKHGERRVSVMVDSNKNISARLKELYYKCMVERTLREPETGIALIPHGIETPSHVVNIWHYTALPNRRLNTMFTGSQMQCLGIDRAKTIEAELHRYTKDRTDFNMIEVLGLYCLNNLDRVEKTVIEDGGIYKGLERRNIGDLKRRFNETITMCLDSEKLREKIVSQGCTLSRLGTIDITDCLIMDTLTRSGFDAIKLRVELSFGDGCFQLTSPGAIAYIDSSIIVKETIYKLVAPTIQDKKKTDKPVSKVTVRTKKQYPVMELFNLLSTGASYTELLKGRYINGLTGVPMMFSVSDKIKQLINKDAKKTIIFDDEVMSHIVLIFTGLVGTRHNYPVTVTMTKFEGVDLIKIAPDDHTLETLYFPVSEQPVTSFDKEGAVREFLSGNRSVPTLFSIYVFLLFPYDHDINGKLLKIPEFEKIVKESNISGVQKSVHPITDLIEQARLNINTNRFFREFVLEHRITIYDRDGGGYIIQKGNEQVVIKHTYKESDIQPTNSEETHVAQEKDRTSKETDRDTTVSSFMKWRSNLEENNRRQKIAEELKAEKERPMVQNSQWCSLPMQLLEEKQARGSSFGGGPCDFSVSVEHSETFRKLKPLVCDRDFKGDEINQLPETTVEKIVETNTQKADLQKRAKAIAGLFVRHHEHGFEGFGILRHILKDISAKPGFEFALQDVGIHIECTDDIPPQVFAYCFVNEEGGEEDVAVKIDFDLQKDIVDLYVDEE
jgi:hypothetical protein|tara:strand:+ start:63 stop:2291 length:2229 start_codon:yes stop_codon:yes gene_type:complete